MTQARKELFQLAEELQNSPSSFISLTKDGVPKVVMFSQEEFDAMMATFEILNDPKARKMIEKSEKEIARGEYVSLEEAEKFWFPKKQAKASTVKKIKK